MKRREFMTLLGGAAAWPAVARAQKVRRVGILLFQPASMPTEGWVAVFQRRLAELGWAEDRNVRFERRYAGANPERMRALIAEIVGLKPDIILAQNTPMVAALRKQTATIPIVFLQVSDPVGDGFVKSLARPGGNITGFTNATSSLGGKWVELLKETAPSVSQLGYLFNRAVAPGGGAYYLQPLLAAAAKLGVKTVSLDLSRPDDIDAVIADFAAAGGNAVIGNSDSFITANRNRIVAAANRLRLPSVFSSLIIAKAGGLLAYGVDTEQQWLAAAGYVNRILRGEKPEDLPVQQPTKFFLVVNQKTAKTLGITVPPTLLARADEVIE